MFATLVSHSSLLPAAFLKQHEKAMQEFFGAFGRLFPVADEHRREESSIMVDRRQQALFAELMRPVKKTKIPGEYGGATMEHSRTLAFAQTTGDWNPVHCDPKKPHPLFGKPIAHGMDAVTQAFSALRLETDGELAPKTATIAFRQPVFPGEDRLRIRITTPEASAERNIVVLARAKKAADERVVVMMRVHLKGGTPYDDGEWFRSFMGMWRISALLAKTWPGCLYSRQELSFRPPPDHDTLTASVRGAGQNDKGHCVVHTQAHQANQSLLPAVSGIATIVLPAA